jgi:hypothetical protein
MVSNTSPIQFFPDCPSSAQSSATDLNGEMIQAFAEDTVSCKASGIL